jgi:hypothetical protein
MDDESKEFLGKRKIQYRIKFLTTDRVLDQELDENACPWENDSYFIAKSKAREVLSRDGITEVYINAEFCVETVKK